MMKIENKHFKQFLSPKLALIGAILMSASLIGCGTGGEPTAMDEVPLTERLTIANEIAKTANFTAVDFSLQNFKLFGYQRIGDKTAPLMVYLEDDGYIVAKRNRITFDPTPLNPIGLELAALDKSPNVLWLARPCQYSLDVNDNEKAGVIPDYCDSRYWSSARYSEEIITAIEQAVNEVMVAEGLSGLHLIGYGGGGAVAVLLADRLKSVQSLRTIAGDIDPTARLRQRGFNGLSGSLDPARIAPNLKDLPQFHFSGEDDEEIPTWVTIRFVKEYVGDRCARVLLAKDVEHEDGWTDFWDQAHLTLPSCL